MIGFIYDGQVNYITRIEDFREFMQPAVYDAMISAFNAGIIDNYREKYEELRDEYNDLQEDYVSLQNEKDEETCFLEQQVDELTDKVEALLKNIKKLVDELYQGYLKPEDLVYELEKLI